MIYLTLSLLLALAGSEGGSGGGIRSLLWATGTRDVVTGTEETDMFTGTEDLTLFVV